MQDGKCLLNTRMLYLEAVDVCP